MSAVKGFLQFIKEMPESDPGALLEVTETLIQHQLIIPVYKIAGQKEAIQLLTAHSAKGLEFEHVFMFNLVEKEWSKRGGSGNFRFSLPDNLAPQQEQDYLESRRRLFYVGMTRAKKGLNFSYSGEGRTSFIDEAIYGSGIQAIPEKLNEEEIFSEIETELLTSTAPILGEREEDCISSFLEKWKMSASSLSQYLKCPVAFYYTPILGVPSEISDAMTYGEVIHKALERYFKFYQTASLVEFPDSKVLTDYFDEEMENKRRFFSPHGFEVFSAMGNRNLDEYYTNSANRWNKDFRVEFEVNETKFEDITITGKLDKIEIQPDGRVRIIDYKTSKVDVKKISAPTDKLPFGGDYWRQMWFYKILFETGDAKKRKVSGAVIDYAGHQESSEQLHLDIHFNNQEEDQFLEILRNAYQRIQQREFNQGCEDVNCRWCNFTNPHD